MKAVWNGTVIADSPDTVIVEGNHYFPRESVNAAFLEPSAPHKPMPLEGHGELLFAERQWRTQRKRRVVLHRPERCGGENQRPRCILERCECDCLGWNRYLRAIAFCAGFGVMLWVGARHPKPRNSK